MPETNPLPGRLSRADEGLFAAAEVWLSSKFSKRLLPKTLECCGYNLRPLKRFFGDVALSSITIDSIRAYQEVRTEGAGVFAEADGKPHPVGASAVNHELNVLQQILRRAGHWTKMADSYAALKERDWQAPKTFTTREEARIFEVSASGGADTELFDIVSRIARNTTASGCELRGLRHRDLELHANPPRIHIPPEATKNNVRPRTIPLNREAREAFERAIARAQRLGSDQPYHYLFPFRVNRRRWDPLRPASKSWLRKQTDKMREKTGIPHIRPHAFRHLAVTELLESGVPEQTVVALAGWVGRRMIETYSHARIEAKMDAVRLLQPSAEPHRRTRPQHSAAATKVVMFPGR